jgi:hypothetical protein
MTNDERLRLFALDADDLAILSAHAQDAVVKIRDMHWLANEKHFVLAINRFVWEKAAGRRWRLTREYQRRRAVLHFARVENVRSTGIDRAAAETVLSLLAMRFDPAEPPAGEVVLEFAGGATIRLEVECIEAELGDLGPAWSTDHAPRHALA